MKDAKGVENLRCEAEDGSKGMIKQTWILNNDKAIADTSITYRYINEKGELMRSEYEGKQFEFHNASLYYHNDGLLDSIHHVKSKVGTVNFLFFLFTNDPFFYLSLYLLTVLITILLPENLYKIFILITVIFILSLYPASTFA